MGRSTHELARIALFQCLTPAEIERLETIVHRQSFKSHAVVFFEDDTSDSLYGVITGAVKVYRTTDSGEERILDILGAGDVFGEYSLIDGHPRSASVSTLEPSTLVSISHTEFRRFVTEASDLLWRVLELFTDRMRRQTREMMEFSRRDVSFRLVSILLKLADKCGRSSGEGRTIPLVLSAESLAEMVASSADRVTRLLNRFQSEGLIGLTRDELIVFDIDALRRSLDYMQEPAW